MKKCKKDRGSIHKKKKRLDEENELSQGGREK